MAASMFGATPRGYYTPRSGYIRARPRQLHTPPEAYWFPPQDLRPTLQEYGTPYNNPIPNLHHDQAVRGSGRFLRIPLRPRYPVENYVPDGVFANVTPDATLNGYNAAALGPEQFPPIWGYFPQPRWQGADLW